MFVHVPSAWLSYLAYGGTGLFGLLYLIRRQRLDRGGCANRHEGRRVDDAMGGFQLAAPRRAIRGKDAEGKAGHGARSIRQASPYE